MLPAYPTRRNLNADQLKTKPSMHPLGPNLRNQWRVDDACADLRRPDLTPHPITVEAQFKPVTLDLSRTAILVIDMQNDFCHMDGWLAGIGVDVAGACAPVTPLNVTLPKLRAAGVPVIWVNWGNRPDRANISPALLHVYKGDGVSPGIGDPLPRNGEKVLTEGSWAAAIVDGLEVAEEDLHVAKFRMSGFWDTPLDSILRQLRVDTLLFAGINTDQCVLHTLADANFHGYDTILVEDLTATTSPDYCFEAAVYNCRQIFGFTLKSADLNDALDARETR